MLLYKFYGVYIVKQIESLLYIFYQFEIGQPHKFYSYFFLLALSFLYYIFLLENNDENKIIMLLEGKYGWVTLTHLYNKQKYVLYSNFITTFYIIGIIRRIQWYLLWHERGIRFYTFFFVYLLKTGMIRSSVCYTFLKKELGFMIPIVSSSTGLTCVVIRVQKLPSNSHNYKILSYPK